MSERSQSSHVGMHRNGSRVRTRIGLGLLAMFVVTTSTALASVDAATTAGGVSATPPIHAVFAPGTPRSYVDAFDDALVPADLAQLSVEATLGPRWTRTATDGDGLGQGDPTTVTWGIAPDGTPIPGLVGEPSAPSNLVARLGAIYGVTTDDDNYEDEPWFPLLERVTARWGAMTGLTYVYEPNDDKAPFSLVSDAAPGVTGVRGDVRIGGHGIDGNDGTLAYNAYPNNGEMVIDTDDSFYSRVSAESLGLRNVLAHEMGHGIGLAHVESNNAAFLMEPYVSSAFDGPQYDDILAAQRHYGDALEASSNNSPFTATPLGPVRVGTTVTIGKDVATTALPLVSADVVSIDDNDDIDVYSFSLDVPAEVDLLLTPVGPTYNRGEQHGLLSPFDASAQSDLSLELVDTDRSTVLFTANASGLGGAEAVDEQFLAAGTYFARVTGAADTVQTYRLDVSARARSIDVGITTHADGTEAGPADGVFEVTQEEPLPEDTVLDYVVSGSATAGTDFATLSGSVTIPAGITSIPLVVPVIDDTVVEGPEDVTVTFTDVTSSTADAVITIAEPSATLDIIDDDTATVSVTGTTDGDEDGPVDGVFTVNQSTEATADTVITYRLDGAATSGEDYAAPSGVATIPAGATTATIVLHTLDDDLLEGTEDVVVTLTGLTSDLAGVTPDGDADAASIDILDDELPPNSPPSITALTGSGLGTFGRPVSLDGAFVDADPEQAHVVTVDWGDGTTTTLPATQVDSDGGTFSATHTYAEGGLYDIVATVDDSHETDSEGLRTEVSGVRLTADGDLQIVGSDGQDDVDVDLDRDGSIEVDVKLDKDDADLRVQRTFAAADVRSIRVVLHDGDDKATADEEVVVPVRIDGGEGDDDLRGGAGDDHLVGGPGRDQLRGDEGDDVLVGGEDRDKLDGGDGQNLVIGGSGSDDVRGSHDGGPGDILIAGGTSFDDDETALREILLDGWIVPLTAGADYHDVVADLAADRLVPGDAVVDDGARDKVRGDKDARDVFFAAVDGPTSDKVTGDDGDRVIALRR